MFSKKRIRTETLFIPGSLSDYIPDDHILKLVDKVLDLSWLDDEVKDCYSSCHGRPCIEPEKALRLMIAGFLHGVVHDRKLMRQAQVNIAYRWFAGYELGEELPDHSSLTRIRQRWTEDRFRRIFERVVKQCVDARLVGGDMTHCDASLIRADVSWESLVSVYVEKVVAENSDKDSPSDNKDDAPKPPAKGKMKKKSKTDPDASMATSNSKIRLQPTYKQHTATDNLNGIVVDVEVTTGEVNEGVELLNQLKRVRQTVGKQPKVVTADKTYGSGGNYLSLERLGVKAVIPPQKVPLGKGGMPLRRFSYDPKQDVVCCPEGKTLKKGSRCEHGWFYRARGKDCRSCPKRRGCFSATSKSRSVIIVDGYPALLRARREKMRGWDDDMVAAYKRHRHQVEGKHGESKTQHGLGRAVRRGLWNVKIQSYLTATVMNLKVLAKAFLFLKLRRTFPVKRCIICFGLPLIRCHRFFLSAA